MLRLKLVPARTAIPFMRWRKLTMVLSLLAVFASLGLTLKPGLNFGIDFLGGILIEVRMPGEQADLQGMRSTLGGLGLGEVTLQEFGQASDVLIRIERQPGDDAAQQPAVEIVKAAMASEYGEQVDYRRVEIVGPTVSQELIQTGGIAIGLAVMLMLIYIWFRFEWHFGVGAVVALVHDVALAFGMFAVFQLEFNLSTIAALLTIVGYSINDTVVVYDRVRENLRRYKSRSIEAVLDQSINDTLARTVMTSVTTLLALFALFIFGGPVIQSFVAAMIWGVIVGTYSSIFIASPVLIMLGIEKRRGSGEPLTAGGDAS